MFPIAILSNKNTDTPGIANVRRRAASAAGDEGMAAR
jgi:hypothetical protein